MPPKAVQQKQKQSVIVNINQSKKRSRTKRKNAKKLTGLKNKSSQSSSVSVLPAPSHQVYISPVHNLVPQVFGDGQRLNIPTLGEQQINQQTNQEMKNKMDKLLYERMNKQFDNELESLAKREQSNRPYFGLDDLSEYDSQNKSVTDSMYNRFFSPDSLDQELQGYYNQKSKKIPDDMSSISEFSSKYSDNSTPAETFYNLNQSILREQPKNQSLTHQINDDTTSSASWLQDRQIHRSNQPITRFNPMLEMGYPSNEEFPPSFIKKVFQN